MIVNHFNTFPYGGAANAALRLHREFKNQGVDSRFLYSMQDRPFVSESAVGQIEWSIGRPSFNEQFRRLFDKRRIRTIHKLFDRHLANRNPDLEVFSMPDQTKRDVPDNAADVSGIVHLHWIAFMADYASFFGAISNDVPIVWTLHDMNPITGGCHYSGGCNQFTAGCGSCPQVLDAAPSDISSHGFRVKQNAYRHKNMTVVSPSQWLKRLAEQSPVFAKTTTFHHIRLGFDLKQLRPLPKGAAREKLGITTDQMLIGFGAESVNNRRKGLDLLLPALARLKRDTGVECLVLGGGETESAKLDLPRIHTLGYLEDPEQIAQFYSACDFVVVPSREDNQPQVGLEAMACGTPVVGFNVGGIAEYVDPGITGWLAIPEDITDLANQMRKLAANPEARLNMAARCRQLMEREFNIVKQAQKYLDLYRRISSSHRRRRVA